MLISSRVLILNLATLVLTSCGDVSHLVADTSSGGSNWAADASSGTGGSSGGGSSDVTAGTSTGGTAISLGGAPTGGATAGCGDPVVKARFPACEAARDQASCETLGGRWGSPYAGVQFPDICNCPTGDEDCPCTQGSECSLGCYASMPDGDVLGQGCAAVTSGKCAAWPGWGCYCVNGGVVSNSGDGFVSVCIN